MNSLDVDALEARLRKLKDDVAVRAVRNTPEAAYAALMSGTGTQTDLDIHYEVSVADARRSITTGSIALFSTDLESRGYTALMDVIRVMRTPPGHDVGEDTRRRLAEHRARANPLRELSRTSPKLSERFIRSSVEGWVNEQVVLMMLEREERELREAVMAGVPDLN